MQFKRLIRKAVVQNNTAVHKRQINPGIQTTGETETEAQRNTREAEGLHEETPGNSTWIQGTGTLEKPTQEEQNRWSDRDLSTPGRQGTGTHKERYFKIKLEINIQTYRVQNKNFLNNSQHCTYLISWKMICHFIILIFIHFAVSPPHVLPPTRTSSWAVWLVTATEASLQIHLYFNFHSAAAIWSLRNQRQLKAQNTMSRKVWHQNQLMSPATKSFSVPSHSGGSDNIKSTIWKQRRELVLLFHNYYAAAVQKIRLVIFCTPYCPQISSSDTNHHWMHRLTSLVCVSEAWDYSSQRSFVSKNTSETISHWHVPPWLWTHIVFLYTHTILLPQILTTAPNLD